MSVAVLLLLLSFALVTPPVRAALGPGAVRAAAAVLLTAPMLMFAFFTIMQALPHGRDRVAVVRGSSDGWLLALVLLSAGPKGALAELAGPAWGAAERAFSISLVTGTLCVIARVIQLNLDSRRPLA